MKTSCSRFAKCLYFTTNSLARKVEKIAINIWKSIDLSPSHAYLLLAVIEEPGIQPTALSDQLQLTPSTITRLIEKLEKNKLVIRVYDGKMTNVYPTNKSKSLLPTMQKCMDEFYHQYSEILGKEDSEKLVEGMARMADKLK